MPRSNVMQRVLPFVASAAIVAGGFVWNAHETARRETALGLQMEQIQSLQGELSSLQSENASKQRTQTEQASGVSYAREKADRDLAEDFLQDCASWDSYESYCACRERAMKDYGLAEDSQFLTSYMAPIGVTKFTDGTEYNYIDAEKLNTRIYGVDDYLVSAENDVYRHFAFVTFRTERDGRHADNQAIMSYAVDGNNRIFDVEVENI